MTMNLKTRECLACNLRVLCSIACCLLKRVKMKKMQHSFLQTFYVSAAAAHPYVVTQEHSLNQSDGDSCSIEKDIYFNINNPGDYN